MEEIKLHQFREKLELKGYARRTISEYCDYVTQFMRYLEEHEGVKNFKEIEPEHLNAFHAHLHYTKGSKDTYLSVGSVRLRLAALKTFYRVMYEEGLITQNYAPLIVLPHEVKSIPSHVPTEEDMRKLLDSISPSTPLRIRNRCILELLYATGIRNEELCTLTFSSIDFNEKTMFVKGKGSKDRVVPIGEWVLPWLKEYLLISRPKLVSRNPTATDLFFVSKTGRTLKRNMLGYIVRTHSKKAGLAGKVTPHSFRHACATHLLKAGADIRYVQELLGHELLSTTQIYTRVEISFLKKMHHKYHPRERQIHE
jgi:site-specific recombinase XerD